MSRGAYYSSDFAGKTGHGIEVFKKRSFHWPAHVYVIFGNTGFAVRMEITHRLYLI